MGRDAAARSPAPRAQEGTCLQRPQESEGRGHRRCQSAPVDPGATFSEPDERTNSTPSFLSDGRSSVSGTTGGSRRRASGAFRCPQSHHPPPARHRRAVSLTSDFHASAARDTRGSSASGGSRKSGGRSAQMQELAMEALHRPPLRYRAEAQSSCAQSSCNPPKAERDGLVCGNSSMTGGSGRRLGGAVSGSPGHVGVENREEDRSRFMTGSSTPAGGAGAGSSLGKEVRTNEVDLPNVDVAGGLAAKEKQSPTPLPALPGLSTRRSSDSTVGIWDSPRHAPEGLKTDEEDYLGRKPRGNHDGSFSQSHATEVTPTGQQQKKGTEGGVDDKAGGMGSTGAAARRLPVKYRREESEMASDLASTTTGTSNIGARTAGVVNGENDLSPAISRCESGSADDATTRFGSFHVPSATSHSADPRPTQFTAARSLFDCRRSGTGAATAGDGHSAAPTALGNNSAAQANAALPPEDSSVVGAALQSSRLGAGAFGVRHARASGNGDGADFDGGLDGRPSADCGGRGRLGSMLDVYREPEPCAQGNDWGELEDWQGLSRLDLGSGGIGGAQSSLHVPPLIFRSGAVNEGDVLSLLGKPRSRKPATSRSPRARGSSSPTGAQAGTMLPGEGEQSWADREAAVDASGGGTARTPGRICSPSRSIKGSGVGIDCAGGGSRADNTLNAAGRAVDRGNGSGGQPLLLSLADLTTAGLQKLLQAEGDSKMFFDPDAQRWVGEEVDLSGFEDPSPPGAGPVRPCSSAGSAAAAATAAGAAAAAVAAATAADFAGPPPFTSADEFSAALSPVRVRALASEASPRARVPTAAHRRWSSGEGIHGGGHLRRRSQASERGGAASAQQLPGSTTMTFDTLHRRRHSSGKRLDGGSGPGTVGRHRRAGSGSNSRNSGSAGERAGASGALIRECDRNTARAGHGGSSSKASSIATSSFRSDSDTGSVIRLWEVGGGGPRVGAGAGPGAGFQESRCQTPLHNFDAEAWRADGLLVQRPRTAEPRIRGSPGSRGVSRRHESDSASSTPARRKRLSPDDDGDETVIGPRAVHRLAFDGTAVAPSLLPPPPPPDGIAAKPPKMRSPQPPSGEALVPPSGSPVERRWPWVSLSTESSPLMGLESGLASESELGASETSDWDQDNDFEDLPENPEFKLTLEKPTKFGYSPSYITGGGGAPSPASRRASAALGSNDSGAQTGSNLLDAPPFAPSLFRNSTAPPTSGGGAANSIGNGGFVEWPLKGVSDGGNKIGRHQRRGTFTDQRFDSKGSAAEWEQTLEGDIDISKAHRPRSPQGTAPAPPVPPPPPAGQTGTSGGVMSSPAGPAPVPPGISESGTDYSDSNLGDSMLSGFGFNSGTGGGISGGSAGHSGRSPVSAVSVAWEAFKAHSASAGGSGGNIGDALTNTIRAAATATSLAVEHLRRRSRNRLLHEKGVAGSGRRLSGPLQITLEDLKAPPAPVGVSTGDGEEAPGDERGQSTAAANETGGAHFNPDKMCWEGFEEPDLTGFETSDSEAEKEPEPPGVASSRPVPTDAFHQQQHLPGLGLGLEGAVKYPTFDDLINRNSSDDVVPGPVEARPMVPSAVGKTFGRPGSHAGVSLIAAASVMGNIAVEVSHVQAAKDAVRNTLSRRIPAALIPCGSALIDQTRNDGALIDGSGTERPVGDQMTDMVAPTDLGRIESSAGHEDHKGVEKLDAKAQVREDAAEQELPSGSSSSSRDSGEDSGFEQPVAKARETGGRSNSGASFSEAAHDARAPGSGLVETIARSLAVFSPTRRAEVAANRDDTAVGAGGEGVLERRSSAADGPIGSREIAVEKAADKHGAVPAPNSDMRSIEIIGKTQVDTVEGGVMCDTKLEKRHGDETVRQETESSATAAGAGVAGDDSLEVARARSRTPTQRNDRTGSGGSSSNTTTSEISDWDRNLGSPTAAIEAAAASVASCPPLIVHARGAAAASAAAAALPGHRNLDSLEEEGDLLFRVGEPGAAATGRDTSEGLAWSRVGGTVGAVVPASRENKMPQGRRVSVGPVLFTPEALDVSALSTSGIGMWGEGPLTVAPTPKHPRVGTGVDGDLLSGAVASSHAESGVGWGRATNGIDDDGWSGGEVQSSELTVEIGSVEERSGCAEGGRMQNMVSRSIFAGPTGEAEGLEEGENDVRASTSHMTKSTEDDTVDDWGADFVGGLCLTPKTGGGGSMWGHGELEGFDEEENEDAAFSPSPPETPPEAAPAASPAAYPKSKESKAKDHNVQRSSATLSPRPLFSSSFDYRGYPRQTSMYNSFPGRAGSIGGGLGVGRGHHSPPPARSTVYGPSVKRIPVEISSDALLIGSNSGARGFRTSLDGSTDSGDEEDGEDGHQGSEAREREAGDTRDVGGGGASGVEGRPRARKEYSFRRRRRSRGYQTISKRDYTPMYVPTAWLNPKSGRWEPSDGYAVDMSGFGDSEGPESESSEKEKEKEARRGSGLSKENSWRSVGGGGGSNNALTSPPLCRGQSSWTTPPSQEQLRRRGSISTNSGSGSGGGSRAAAFHLSQATLKHLAKSEQAHDQAMIAFLGDHGYSQAKRQGAALLLRLPGIESAAQTSPTPVMFAKNRGRKAASILSPNKSSALHKGSDVGLRTAEEDWNVTGYSPPSQARRSLIVKSSAVEGGERGLFVLSSSSPRGDTRATGGVSSSNRGADSTQHTSTSSRSQPQQQLRPRIHRQSPFQRSSISTASSTSVSPTRPVRLSEAALRRGSARSATQSVAVTASSDAAGGNSRRVEPTARPRGRTSSQSTRTTTRTRSSSSHVIVSKAVGRSARSGIGAGGGSNLAAGSARVRHKRRLSGSQPARSRRPSHATVSGAAANAGEARTRGSGTGNATAKLPLAFAPSRQMEGPRRRPAVAAGHSSTRSGLGIDTSPLRSPVTPTGSGSSSSTRRKSEYAASHRLSTSSRTSPRALRSSGDPTVPSRDSPTSSTSLNPNLSSNRTGQTLEIPQCSVGSAGLGSVGGGLGSGKSSPSSPPAQPWHGSPPLSSVPRPAGSPPLHGNPEAGRYGLEEAVLRRAMGCAASAAGPLSPRSYRFNRTSSQGRAGVPRSMQGSSTGHGSPLSGGRGQLAAGTVVGGGGAGSSGDGVLSPIGGGPQPGESATAVAAAEKAKIARRMGRFRDTAEFASNLVRDCVATTRRNFGEGSVSSQSGDFQAGRGHRRRRSGGASSGGSGSSVGVISTSGINPSVWR